MVKLEVRKSGCKYRTYENKRFAGHDGELKTTDFAECLKNCREDSDCYAATYAADWNHKNCFKYRFSNPREGSLETGIKFTSAACIHD